MLALALLIGCNNQEEPVGAFGYANIDDDDEDGRPDWRSSLATDDDRTPLLLDLKGSTRSLSLTLADGAGIRVWLDGEIILSEDRLTTEVPVEKKVPVGLEVEFQTFNTDTTLSVQQHNKGGKEIGDAIPVPLRSGPLLMNHHLQHAIEIQSVNIPSYTDPLVDAYDTHLGDRYRRANGERFDFDVWMQDEFEFVTVHGREGSTGAVIDSIRDRGLDDFAEDALTGPGMGHIVKGDTSIVTSQDSFGNLEASPPVDGYPFGRIYYGVSQGRGVAEGLATYLENNTTQDAFTLDVEWLCVGHVDEFVSFVPDATSPKGFKVALADTHKGWELLEAMDPSTILTKYIPEYGRRTVADITGDPSLRIVNEESQAAIDAGKRKLIEELGLVESDFIYIPDIFEIAPQCFGAQAALIPGMVNLVVDNPRGGPSRIFLADPFVRTGLGNQGSDPFIAEVKRIMPPEHELVFVDNWDAYHVALGEVHCGSNVTREPHEAAWWPTHEKQEEE